MGTGPALLAGNLLFPLNKITCSVGRKDRITNMVPDVDLGSLDEERSVSRRHAELAYGHGSTVLRDIGSVNGTTVNGERIAHNVDRPLQDGDTVAFGVVNMTFHTALEWPEGVEAEWPPEVPEPSAEETMIAGGTEETMVAAPMGSSEETMVAPPAFDAGETAVFAPVTIPEVPPAPAEPPAPPVEEAPPAYVPQPMEAYVSCTSHPHVTAVGLCPGCLDPFCMDCLPEREDGLMVCNRCAGINYRLSAVGTPG